MRSIGVGNVDNAEVAVATILEDMFRHHLWANLKLLDLCAGLEEGQLDLTAPGTYGRVRDTLVHIVANEENYLAGLTGEEPEQALRQGGSFPGVGALREHAERSGERLIALAAQLDGSTVLTGTFRGRRYAMSAAVPMIQVINHATERRGHVVSILTQHGVDVPGMDGWEFGKSTGLLTVA